MKKNLQYKLLELFGYPILIVGVLLFIFINILITNNIEKEFKEKLEITSKYVTNDLDMIIENERDKLMVIASDRDLNIMLKYNAKVEKTWLYTVDEYDNGKNAYILYLKKIENNLEYINVINLLKKTLYKEPRMSEISLEVFNKEGKMVIGSYGEYIAKKTNENDINIENVLNKNTVFKIKKMITYIEEFEGRPFFKIMVPVPERTYDNLPDGVIVLTYPIDTTLIESIKNRIGADLIIFDKNIKVLNGVDAGSIDFKGKEREAKEGKIVKILKNKVEYSLKAIPLKNMTGDIICYIAVIKDRKEIESIKNISMIIVAVTVIILLICYILLSIYESKKITTPINLFLNHMKNIENGEYKEVGDINLIPEIDAIREHFNHIIKKIKNNLEEIRRRDETLVVMNKELLTIIKEKEKMYKLSITDGLTGVYNHKYFQEVLTAEINRSIKYNLNLSLLMVDIDFFKRFNDEFGHQTGDDVIAKIAALLKDSARDGDTVARYGGEEFAIILANTPNEGAVIVAERVRKMIELLSAADKKISVSIGIATFPLNIDDYNIENTSSNEIKNELIKKADIALYASKDKGRNRTTRYEKFIEMEKNIYYKK
jgi:diguanylate cyclase (GGDEF)-like protein